MLAKAIAFHKTRQLISKLSEEGEADNEKILIESKYALLRNYNRSLFILKISLTALIVTLLTVKIIINSDMLQLILTTIICFSWLVITLESLFATYYSRYSKKIASLEFFNALLAVSVGLIPQLFILVDYLDEFNIPNSFL